MRVARTRTLDDVLVSAIQRAPRQEFSKLALADLLTEKGLDAQAEALRWCARTRRWPQRQTRETGNTWWQWWHYTTRDLRSRAADSFRGYCIQPWAVLPRELSSRWPRGQIWSAGTWLGALELLVRPLAGRGVLVSDREAVQ